MGGCCASKLQKTESDVISEPHWTSEEKEQHILNFPHPPSATEVSATKETQSPIASRANRIQTQKTDSTFDVRESEISAQQLHCTLTTQDDDPRPKCGPPHPVGNSSTMDCTFATHEDDSTAKVWNKEEMLASVKESAVKEEVGKEEEEMLASVRESAVKEEVGKEEEMMASVKESAVTEVVDTMASLNDSAVNEEVGTMASDAKPELEKENTLTEEKSDKEHVSENEVSVVLSSANNESAVAETSAKEFTTVRDSEAKSVSTEAETADSLEKGESDPVEVHSNPLVSESVVETEVYETLAVK